MLIDIPKQINCGYCPFKEEGSGWCLLREALDPKGDWCTAKYCNESFQEECRPDWCPFKRRTI